MLISGISSEVSSVQGCVYFREQNESIELGLLGQQGLSICNIIIDKKFKDVLHYEMSVEVFQEYSSSQYGFPGVIFNVQEGRGSWDNTEASSKPPNNYDFAFLRYLFI